MKKEKSKKIKLLLILLLVISVGYALISTVLKINGSARFAKKSWNIYWANPQVTEGSKTMVKPTIVDDGSNGRNAKVTWNVTFELPGEFYEFTIDAVNAGDIDAVITGIDTNVTPELPEYISYKVTYDNGKKVKQNQYLPAATGGVSTVVRYKVRIDYLLDKVDATVINNMESNVSLTYNFGVTYGRSDGPAMKETELTPSEMEEFIALVEANPDSYRNKKQNPANRDIGIDVYGNVINLDDFHETPGAIKDGCKNYELYEDGGKYIEFKGCGYVYEHGLKWATASEYFDEGEWTLNLPAYILIDGEDSFAPVTNIGSFFTATDYSNIGVEFNKMPNLPYTINYLGSDVFRDVKGFTGPVTIPETVTYIDSTAFKCAYKPNVPNIIKVPSSFDEYVSFDYCYHDYDDGYDEMIIERY